MKEISFPYGKEKMSYSFNPDELTGVLESSIETYKPSLSPEELIKEALENPVASEKLSVLARGKNKVTIISSDHTRPVPSRIIMPLILKEIREGNPDADITILIATGCHRGTTSEELRTKFGEEIVNNEKIYIHDCDDESMLVNIGKLPSGGDCLVNKLAYEADLLVSEGFIEPHLFAGYTGGRKSILPGVSSRKTVMYNHCAQFIASDRARTGILDGNPIHKDMLWA
ncbi:MAG: nickel-dependent lactate racemase, partial [Clostridiales bacterium]|nr:nickel-dependent lactate racemase [Candidatus Equinaster intestinalis]